MSNIPIYPKETRQVIEVINSVPGIIMAGHPGGTFTLIVYFFFMIDVAGGYDAIFVLYSISNGCTTALETIQEIMHRYETPFIHIN